MNPTNEITFNGLGNPEQPIQTPPAQTSVEPLATFTAPTAQETQALNTAQTNANTSEQDYMDALFGGSTIESSTLRAEENAGLPQLQTQLTDITNQIMKTDLDFRREREMLQTEPGLTTAQRQARLADVTRKQSSQLADLEVIRSARSNTLTNAQSIIQKKVNAEFAEQEKNLNGLKFLAERADGKLKTQLDAVAKKEERAFGLAKSEFEKVESEKLQLVRNAQANGADNGTMSAILGSKTLQDAYKNAGRFGVSIDDKIKKAQLNKINAELSANGKDTLTAEQEKNLPTVVARAEDKIKQIQSLLANKIGLKASAGALRGKPLGFGNTINDWRADLINITQSLTLDELGRIKADGVTFGALSEGERKAVGDAANVLNSAMIVTGDGETKTPTGKLKISEDKVREALAQVEKYIKIDFERKTGLSYDDYQNVTSGTQIQVDPNGNIVVPGDVSDEEYWN